MSDQNAAPSVRKAMTPKAVAALVLAISGCLAGWYGIPGIICGIIGLNLSKSARAALDANPTFYRGEKFITEARKWSIAGIVEGAILTVFWIFYIVFFAGLAARYSY